MDKFNISEDGKKLIKYNGQDSLVVIPEGVEEIGTNAFVDCDSIISIKLPSSIKKLHRQAINDCNSLSEINIDNNVECNGCSLCSCHSFKNCLIIGNKLIRVPETTKGTYVIPNGITEISNGAFCKCKLITEIIIPNSVNKIGTHAFDSCDGLTEITIPCTILDIGINAFSKCNSLSKVIFQEGSKCLFWGAFDCPNLREIIIPDSMQPYMILDKNNDKEDVYGDSVLSEDVREYLDKPIYNKHSFFGLPTTFKGEYSVPEGITYIDSFAFAYCNEVDKINLPQSIIAIGKYAFDGCRKLEVININDNIRIDGRAFTNCMSLRSSITIGNKLIRVTPKEKDYIIDNDIISIEKYAFQRCDKITSIIIPKNVNKIGNGAFVGCVSLETVIFEEDSSVYDIGEAAFFNCKSLKKIIIPKSVNKIKDEAFKDCVSLETVIFEDCSNVCAIGKEAFINCKSLINIRIPRSVNSIDNMAFKDCVALEKVIFENESSLCNIGSSAFYNCKSLKNIIIPRGIPAIKDHTFENCISLEKILIPSSVNTINRSAFSGCSNIESAYMSGKWGNRKRIELGLPLARYNSILSDYYDEFEGYKDYLDDEQFYNSGHGYRDASEWRNYSEDDIGATNDSEMVFTNGRLWPCPYCGYDGTSPYIDGTAQCDRCHRWFRYA